MLYQQPVKQVMHRSKIYDVREMEPVSKAIQLLDTCDISALPVRGMQGTYTGVVSKSDIASVRFLQLLKAKGSAQVVLIQEIMNHNPPIYVLENEPVSVAIRLMHKRHIHRLFVANEEGELTGVISTTDILRLLVLE